MTITGYAGHALFENAVSEEGLIRHKNTAKDLNVDPDTGNIKGGICSGITTSWMIQFLNRIAEARQEDLFKANYDVTRFQGAYFKELHGKAPEHLDALRNVMEHNLSELNAQEKRDVTELTLPDQTQWAAYVSAWGHAIGVGRYDSEYFMMDPNYGLFRYTSKENFLTDFQAFVEARADRKNKSDDAKIKCIFYKRTA